jgi:hypothetical protein
MTFTFTSMAQMADYLESKAKSIRSRVPNASARSQDVMRSEAHAYEQSAFIIRNAVINSSVEAA